MRVPDFAADASICPEVDANLAVRPTPVPVEGGRVTSWGGYHMCQQAPIAQSAERLHGKEKVYGSIPYWGSVGTRPLRRSSSAWQSKRLIIAVSPVQVRPPLPHIYPGLG
jgi:hypothetical protein